jgi:hypothetical protein
LIIFGGYYNLFRLSGFRIDPKMYILVA